MPSPISAAAALPTPASSSPLAADVEAGQSGEGLPMASRETSDGEDKTVTDQEGSLAVKLEGQWDNAPEGGYGWVVVACAFAISSVTWGVNNSFGVFIAHFEEHDYYPGGTKTLYALVGGLSVCSAMLAAPLANYLAKSFHYRVPLLIGAVCVTLGQCMAGVSGSFGAYLFCQGILFGVGIGMTFIPVPPIVASYFNKKLSTAVGLAGAGSGFGGLIFSNTTRLAIARLGVRNALVVNGCVSAAILFPATFLMRARVDKTRLQGKLEPLQLNFIWHPGFVWVWTWGVFAIMGYLVAIYSIAAYATVGLGLSQTQGAALLSISGAGQMIGRPLCGIALDRGGRLNVGVIIYLLSGLSCFAFWLPARGFALMAVFAAVQGLLAGTLWFAVASITARVVGPEHMGSALAIFWLAISIPALVAQLIATELVNYSRDHLDRTGPHQYTISIGFCGGAYLVSACCLYGAKWYVQKSPRIMQKV